MVAALFDGWDRQNVWTACVIGDVLDWMHSMMLWMRCGSAKKVCEMWRVMPADAPLTNVFSWLLATLLNKLNILFLSAVHRPSPS